MYIHLIIYVYTYYIDTNIYICICIYKYTSDQASFVGSSGCGCARWLWSLWAISLSTTAWSLSHFDSIADLVIHAQVAFFFFLWMIRRRCVIIRLLVSSAWANQSWNNSNFDFTLRSFSSSGKRFGFLIHLVNRAHSDFMEALIGLDTWITLALRYVWWTAFIAFRQVWCHDVWKILSTFWNLYIQ